MLNSGFSSFRRKQIAELHPWTEGDDLSGVSISDVDRAAGSPKAGDMIARNPENRADQWLVAAAYFAANFEPLTASMPEDVKGLVEELRALNEEDFYQYPASTYRKVNDAATALASLSAKVEELTRERDDIVRRFKRQVHEVGPAIVVRAETAEASLAERDRIIAEKDKALEFYARRENYIARSGMDCPISDDHFGDRARAARSLLSRIREGGEG